MKKYFLLLSISCFAVIFLGAQNLQSPDNFLGYPLGKQFTQHFQIVNYFKQAALTMPKMMQLEKYGETNERRPLLLAFISSPENMVKLEEIRKNNLRLSGMLTDKPADINMPTVVWLSYNVHGNEASSSEVSMKTLYELLNPDNIQTKAWLKNIVVIIDPCINPDGRDRYVNWLMQMTGKNVNPNPDAREHVEPWPGGRVNHYNFDLNRDWAWQTQVETKQRLIKYNQWMPQVHSDYHEQGYNNPYYFAPAAEPFHEVITNWQRSFQIELGKNHAKYFDANGWLYFTKEVFDLFYPSYGDTYPTYNGSIGMTFEQAGHSRGGTAVITNTGDTLTLTDRIAHHFTTSMSTLEAVSKSVQVLNKEFKKFFDDAKNNGVGEYKTFVITEVNSNKINALKSLLDANGIVYGTSGQLALKGFNYFTGKEEMFTSNKSLVISTYQSKGVLAKVLFEPKSKLLDSATYDITAWSMPFVFGLQAYAVREKIMVADEKMSPKNDVEIPLSSYGYLLQYQSFEDAKLLAALLNADIKVRFAERDFKANEKNFNKGTLIILKKGNEDKLQDFISITKKYDAAITTIASGFMEAGFDLGSEKIHFINKPRVAMLTGKGVQAEAAGEVWHLFDQQLNYPITLINAEDLGNTNLKNIDVLILPNGRYKFFDDKDGSSDLKNWVRQGGKIIAIEYAMLQMAGNDWGLKLKKADEEKDKKEDVKPSYNDLKKFADNETEGIKNNIAGAIYKVELDNTHPLAFGYASDYYTLKMNSNIYEFLKDGWNVGVIKKDNYVSGFVGSKLKDKVNDALMLGAQDFGRGSVVYFSDDPIFRCFWENGKLMFSNAVFLVGQ